MGQDCSAFCFFCVFFESDLMMFSTFSGQGNISKICIRNLKAMLLVTLILRSVQMFSFHGASFHHQLCIFWFAVFFPFSGWRWRGNVCAACFWRQHPCILSLQFLCQIPFYWPHAVWHLTWIQAHLGMIPHLWLLPCFICELLLQADISDIHWLMSSFNKMLVRGMTWRSWRSHLFWVCSVMRVLSWDFSYFLFII